MPNCGLCRAADNIDNKLDGINDDLLLDIQAVALRKCIFRDRLINSFLTLVMM